LKSGGRWRWRRPGQRGRPDLSHVGIPHTNWPRASPLLLATRRVAFVEDDQIERRCCSWLASRCVALTVPLRSSRAVRCNGVGVPRRSQPCAIRTVRVGRCVLLVLTGAPGQRLSRAAADVCWEHSWPSVGETGASVLVAEHRTCSVDTGYSSHLSV